MSILDQNLPIEWVAAPRYMPVWAADAILRASRYFEDLDDYDYFDEELGAHVYGLTNGHYVVVDCQGNVIGPAERARGLSPARLNA